MFLVQEFRASLAFSQNSMFGCAKAALVTEKTENKKFFVEINECDLVPRSQVVARRGVCLAKLESAIIMLLVVDSSQEEKEEDDFMMACAFAY